MRETILLCLSFLIGLLMSLWSGWTIWRYIRASKKDRHAQRFHLRIACLVLLIAVGDLAKSLRDLLVFLEG